MNVTFGALAVLREMMLAREPKCGAELTRSLNIASGTMYPLLSRLKQDGYIEFVATLPHPSQPAAHFYQATPKGRALFLDKLCRLTIPDYILRDQPPGVNEEYLKLRPSPLGQGSR